MPPPSASKAKAAAVQLQKVNRAEIVDEFGALDAEVQLFKPKEKRHEALRKEIQAWFENESASENYTVEGQKWTVVVSERAKERKITSMSKLFKFLKQDVFLKACTFPLKAIDALLKPEEQAGIVEQAQTGSRTVKAVSNQEAA